MDRERYRRFFTILFLCFIYIASSFLQSFILGKIETTSSGIIQSATDYAMKTSKIKSYSENTVEKTKVKGDNEESSAITREEEDNQKPSSRPQLSLKSCIPRFICEVHAEGHWTNGETDLEKDILSLFRNSLFLEGPSSPVYPYQIAAHLGQLAAGLIPSPCHNIYSSCPLSKKQLMDLISGVRTGDRKRWPLRR